ncbi:hypothetical protein BV22DRAFT_1135756 [Leucogyrophana mollusca]|uniref:Uncharacterized protein n=1 Tax=Leucogyrophana mollusca TaxID=85980 RepID=A0ACB8AU76_9AGAM|nr:hypothetical protein BV22DRAFT_1135756 [Leucogyrophana mollusca]
MSTPQQLDFIRRRVLSRQPSFPHLIGALVFGADCDAPTPVRLPCDVESPTGVPVAQLLPHIYLIPSRLPANVEVMVDADDSHSDEVDVGFSLRPHNLSRRSRAFARVRHIRLSAVPLPIAAPEIRLLNDLTVFYVEQKYASSKFPRNRLLASKLLAHCGVSCPWWGGVMVVKHSSEQSSVAVDVTTHEYAFLSLVVVLALKENVLV